MINLIINAFNSKLEKNIYRANYSPQTLPFKAGGGVVGSSDISPCNDGYKKEERVYSTY